MKSSGVAQKFKERLIGHGIIITQSEIMVVKQICLFYAKHEKEFVALDESIYGVIVQGICSATNGIVMDIELYERLELLQWGKGELEELLNESNNNKLLNVNDSSFAVCQSSKITYEEMLESNNIANDELFFSKLNTTEMKRMHLYLFNGEVAESFKLPEMEKEYELMKQYVNVKNELKLKSRTKLILKAYLFALLTVSRTIAAEPIYHRRIYALIWCLSLFNRIRQKLTEI